MPYKFNGKELDEETGLYYYGARYYDARISMFYGVDPLAEKYSFQSPFAYAANNPIKFIDVLGMGPEEGEPDGGTPVVNIKLEEIVITAKKPESSTANHNDDWSSEPERYGFNGTPDQWKATYGKEYGLSGDWNEWHSKYGKEWYAQVDKWDKQEVERKALGQLKWFIQAFETMSYVSGPVTSLNVYKSLPKPNKLSLSPRGIGFKTYNVSTKVSGTGNPSNARINYMVNNGTKVKSTYFTNRWGEVIFQLDNAHSGQPAWHGHRMSIPGNLGSGHGGKHVSPFMVPFKFKF